MPPPLLVRTRPAALLALLLALAACDSGGPADEVVGTWALATFTNREVMVVSTTQTVIDLTVQPTGAVTVAGSEAASLSTLNWAGRYGGGLEFSVASFDGNTSPYPERRHFLNVTDNDAYRSVRLIAGDDQTYVEYALPEGDPAPFVREGSTYRFTGGSLVATDSSDRTATLSGALTFGSRTLTAGQRETLSEYRYDTDPSYRVTYEFTSGGALRIRETQGNRTVERVGTWERTGDRLRLSMPTEVPGVTETLTYTVARDGGALLLVDEMGAYPCDADCRRYTEQSYGLQPGTLRSYASEAEIRFAPVAPRADARAEGAAPARPAPAAMRDRLLVRPQGR